MESVEAIVQRAETALERVAPDRLFLNPDCGFATFSGRPVNSAAIGEQKLARIAEAAAELRQRRIHD